MAKPEPKPERYTGETLPAWSLPAAASAEIGIGVEWPERVTREWALGGSTGAGIQVCILDSGVQPDHRLVGEVEGAVALRKTDEGEIVVEEDTEGDLAGHGTACAGIVRSLAPDCRLFSVRVLGAGFKGSGAVLLEGLRWAIGQGFDVINMSLSTTKKQFSGLLHELAVDPDEDAIARIDEALDVHEAMSGLSDNCREILDRFFDRDETYRTIGEQLELPAGTIASRISRCLVKLRDELEGRNHLPAQSGEQVNV